MKSFQELTLPKPIQQAIQELKFEAPTPIQAEAIPLVLSGKDVIGCAQTGSGKTAAFSIPILAHLIANPNQNALVLVPTRELAKQVTDVMRALAKYCVNLRVVDLIGGVSMQPQNRALDKGFRIIVATPGRLVDHLGRRNKLLSNVAILTLDEADRMLDMGFLPQLKQVFRYLPQQRQTLMFSATMAPEIQKLTATLMKSPVKLQIAPSAKLGAPNITQKIRKVGGKEKNEALLDEINSREGTMLVFARTQRRTDRVLRFLTEYGLKAVSIHGGRSQGQRNRAIEGFRDGTYRILVATDIAGRGIDIDHVAHVINYDLPDQAEDYVHRIGRTARAGRAGEAISLVAGEEQALLRDIEKLIGKTIPLAEVQSRPAMVKPAPAPTKPILANKPLMAAKPAQARPIVSASAGEWKASTGKKPIPKNIRFKERSYSGKAFR